MVRVVVHLELDDILFYFKYVKNFKISFYILCILYYFLIYFLLEDYLFKKQYNWVTHAMLVHKRELNNSKICQNYLSNNFLLITSANPFQRQGSFIDMVIGVVKITVALIISVNNCVFKILLIQQMNVSSATHLLIGLMSNVCITTFVWKDFKSLAQEMERVVMVLLRQVTHFHPHVHALRILHII